MKNLDRADVAYHSTISLKWLGKGMMNLKMTVALGGIRRKRTSNTSPERYLHINLLGVTVGRSSSGTESGTATAMDSSCAVYCGSAITHRRAIDTEFPRFFLCFLPLSLTIFTSFRLTCRVNWKTVTITCQSLRAGTSQSLYWLHHRLDDRRAQVRFPVG
jgi:hypothetical protein